RLSFWSYLRYRMPGLSLVPRRPSEGRCCIALFFRPPCSSSWDLHPLAQSGRLTWLDPMGGKNPWTECPALSASAAETAARASARSNRKGPANPARSAARREPYVPGMSGGLGRVDACHFLRKCKVRE
ncbi:unnamed protein product, partial [Ectocarpus sp. 12 AP-2014]